MHLFKFMFFLKGFLDFSLITSLFFFYSRQVKVQETYVMSAIPNTDLFVTISILYMVG